ncbi:lipid droplet associated hydrolase sturkopf isoform X2 [Calliopsis andreniformis]|uniref:lipid droplet associated hydrolase sturkopf isoform X2 n=1 Tax=Calliopsis andreniformis TaxID=337506 RepID=UPI003FCE181E
MQRAMLKWNSVPTQVITQGRWVEEGLSEYGKKDVVVVIPGNPGIPDFYEGFISTLKSRLPSEIPIWVVGHAGHVQPPSNLSVTMPKDSTWNVNYSLTAQLQHKIEFIKKYVPEDARLHLIGHSIGAWLVLNMLKDDSISKRVAKCYLLFPTIEHMAASPNGWFYTTILFIVSIFAPLHGVPLKSNKALLQLLNPHALKKIIKMADEEMIIVKERDDEILSKHADKLWFYYGNCDGWTPVKYYKNMKSKHPHINAELCKNGYHHTFVLQYDKEMGHLVGDIINESLS